MIGASNRYSLWLALAAGVCLAWAARGADDPAAKVRLNDKINAWVDGTLVSVDTDKGSFVVRGSKRPYASAYAQMLKEIHANTSGLEGEQKHAKAEEIRKAWSEKLAAAQKEPFEKDSDFTFYLPSKDATLAQWDESRFYGRPYAPGTPEREQAGEQKHKRVIGQIGLADLKAHQHVIVGYETGIIRNDAYAIICAEYEDLPHRDDTIALNDGTTLAPDNSGVNKRDQVEGKPTADKQSNEQSDLETTRQIRRAIVQDDSLSTYGHNIKIITQNGTVTLKGPVRSDAEKAALEKTAIGIAGEGKVTNQLEVAP